jgi:hypothetical protein
VWTSQTVRGAGHSTDQQRGQPVADRQLGSAVAQEPHGVLSHPAGAANPPDGHYDASSTPLPARSGTMSPTLARKVINSEAFLRVVLSVSPLCRARRPYRSCLKYWGRVKLAHMVARCRGTSIRVRLLVAR